MLCICTNLGSENSVEPVSSVRVAEFPDTKTGQDLLLLLGMQSGVQVADEKSVLTGTFLPSDTFTLVTDLLKFLG